MTKQSKYQSKKADENGVIRWTDEENSVWQTLIHRQLNCIKNRACHEYMEGLNKLNLPQERIPQLHEINSVLSETGGNAKRYHFNKLRQVFRNVV